MTANRLFGGGLAVLTIGAACSVAGAEMLVRLWSFLDRGAAFALCCAVYSAGVIIGVVRGLRHPRRGAPAIDRER